MHPVRFTAHQHSTMINFRPALLCFIFLIFNSLRPVAAQQTFSGAPDWEDSPAEAAYKGVPIFDEATFDVGSPVPKICGRQPLQIATAENYAASFKTISYKNVESAARQTLFGENLPAQPQITTYISYEKGQPFLSFCFVPFVSQNGQIKKVVAYEIAVVPNGGAPESVRRKSGAVVASSVLSSGEWYKISVKETGIFKITPSFLSSNGISSGTVSISDLRLVGNGIGMLPEKNSDPRPDGLLDVPLKIFDQNNNGQFDGSDYAAFYARGPHQWDFQSGSGKFIHRTNIYRDRNYYFLSVNSGPAKSVGSAAPAGAPTVQVSSFDDFAFVEDEDVNLVGTGREWYGDLFDFTLQYSYGFSFPDLDRSQPARFKIRAAGRASSSNTLLKVSVDGNIIVSKNFNSLPTGDKPDFARSLSEEVTFTPAGNSFTALVAYDNSANPAGVAWMDYIEVQARRNLVFRNGALLFRDAQSVSGGAVAEFQIGQANAALQVWDVTDHNDIKEMPVSVQNGTATFAADASSLKEYAAFSGSNLPEPSFDKKTANQDLHGMAATEMLIVAHPNFLSAAQRLADFHIRNDEIPTEVVTTTQVFNEFGSGGQDIAAIRDFAKLMYEKGQAANRPLNYLLLFGDASYDYKDRIANNDNFVPIWESEYSLNLNGSFVTDDFYGLLDADEGGNGNIRSLIGQSLDVSVGRIPCKNSNEAGNYVDKVIHYVTGKNRFGDWRNQIILMADDVDDNWETTFARSSEEFTNIIEEASGAFNVDKIYTDAYQQVSTTGGESYPEASGDMFRKVQQGALITNYIGHGGEIGLSSEKLLKLSDVNGWTNFDALSFFLTITCEFTRVDDPKRVSGGEQLLLNPNGGAIALISTTRVVGGAEAIGLNRSVFRTAFERPGNLPKTFGQIVTDGKNQNNNGDVHLKFSLFGDPAVRLATPYYNMNITEVNQKPLSQGVSDTLKALSKVKMRGEVRDFSNRKMGSFSGIADVTVYDKATQKETLQNDNQGPPIKFDLRNNLIYRGKVEVKSGEFAFEFLVPKDISYQFGNGKISLYSNNGGSFDAAGFMDTIIVGGFNPNPPKDDAGPTVQLFMNDETFVRGGITDQDPELYAVLADSSGINTVGSSIGHDLVAILDDDPNKTFVVNEYYEAELNSYQTGKVRYPFYDLEEGQHTLKMKVFDVHNNFSQAETEFIVAESAELALERVLNYPNPFTNYTEFHFEHNRAGQPLDVQVQVFTVSGKLVKTINRTVVSSGNRVNDITWNGLDDYGDKIGKGVYVYRVKVRAQLDNSQADKYEKLVILR